jgi:hypothetical protein
MKNIQPAHAKDLNQIYKLYQSFALKAQNLNNKEYVN